MEWRDNRVVGVARQGGGWIPPPCCPAPVARSVTAVATECASQLLVRHTVGMADRRRAGSTVIVRGNTSELLPWSPTTVAKVLLPGIPPEWASIEADITSRLHAAGLPVPAVEDTVVVDGRAGIVFERIDGISMWDRMTASPHDLSQLVDMLVSLQADVQATSVDGIPDLATRLRSKISAVPTIIDSERAAALGMLAGLPAATSLCHGDMHPANILITERGCVIVDWFDAACGDGKADFVRSSLLMRPPLTPEGDNAGLSGASRRFLERLHHTYILRLAERRLVDESQFARWEAVLAVARMSEPVPTADLEHIWRCWCEGRRSSVASSLGAAHSSV